MTNEQLRDLQTVFGALLATIHSLASALGVKEEDLTIVFEEDDEEYSLAELREELMDIFKMDSISFRVERVA